MLGKVGSGKGTQARMLAEQLNFSVYSTGDEFRRIIKEGGKLGARVQQDYDAGLLMPYWYAQYLLSGALLGTLERGVVFEGSGRKIQEAELIDEISQWLGISYAVVDLQVSDDEAVRRILARGRGDGLDSEESTRARLEEYRRYTEEVLSYYRDKGNLVVVNGEQDIETVYADMLQALELHE